jgi:hypothetical protein
LFVCAFYGLVYFANNGSSNRFRQISTFPFLQGFHLFENKYTDKMKHKTDKVENFRQMKDIEILTDYSALGPWGLDS